jgi:hypothetical protein
VAEGEEVKCPECVFDGHRCRLRFPCRSDVAPPRAPHQMMVTINGRAGVEVDTLVFDFLRDSFDRTAEAASDPSEQLIEDMANSFLVRYRYVTRAIQAVRIQSPFAWRVHYLNDDGSEIPYVEGLDNVKVSDVREVWCCPLNAPIWERLKALPPRFELPPWQTLLLDAQHHLPALGPAIVLGAAALEAFISMTLDQLAHLGPTPPSLWKWITHRGKRRHNPPVEEQFDALLKIMTGHSLREDDALWRAFLQLKEARNKFAHEARMIVTGPETFKLIRSAWAITEKVRAWLPESLHWPDPDPSVVVECSFPLLPGQ